MSPLGAAAVLPRGRNWPLLSLLLGLIGAAMIAQVVSAQQEATPSPAAKEHTAISVAFEPSSMDGIPHYLAARLVSQDGSAVVGERVSIRRLVDVFGGRTVTIGRATTDNAGIARVPIVPREETYKVSASFGGSGSLAAAEVEDDIVFPAEAVLVPDEVPRGGLVDPQLRPLADVMPLAIGAAVIFVWVVLIGVSLLTLANIRSSRRSAEGTADERSAEAPDTGSGPQQG